MGKQKIEYGTDSERDTHQKKITQNQRQSQTSREEGDGAVINKQTVRNVMS